MNDRWMFWILAPNNITVAKSTHRYATERAAIKAAVKVLAAQHTNGVEVTTR
jgi:hypothetical protein